RQGRDGRVRALGADAGRGKHERARASGATMMDDKKGKPPAAPRVGAPWWRETIASARSGLRRYALNGFGLLGGAAAATGLSGCWDYAMGQDEQQMEQSEDDIDASMDALELQRRLGWNVGAEEPLLFPGATDRDVQGGDRWRQVIQNLPEALAPAQP